MGYYSTFSFNLDKVIVDKEKIKEVETYFSDCEKEDVIGFYNVKLPVVEESNGKTVLEDIELEDYYQKFYDDRVFAEKLKDAIKEGTVKLSFIGEDNFIWGYFITSSGVIDLEGMLLPTKMRPTYCRNCGVLIGYMEAETFKRLNNICDNCAEK